MPTRRTGLEEADQGKDDKDHGLPQLLTSNWTTKKELLPSLLMFKSKDESCSKYVAGVFPMRARGPCGNCQQLIFKDGNQIRALEAETEEEVSEILEYIRTNGYELIAIEGRTHEARKRNGRLLDNV